MVVVINQAFAVAGTELHIAPEFLVKRIAPVNLHVATVEVEGATSQCREAVLAHLVAGNQFEVAHVVRHVGIVVIRGFLRNAIPRLEQQAEVVAVFESGLRVDSIPAPGQDVALAIRLVNKTEIDEAPLQAKKAIVGGNRDKSLRLIIGLAERGGNVLVIDLPVILLGITKPQVDAAPEKVFSGLQLEAELKFRFRIIKSNIRIVDRTEIGFVGLVIDLVGIAAEQKVIGFVGTE